MSVYDVLISSGTIYVHQTLLKALCSSLNVSVNLAVKENQVIFEAAIVCITGQSLGVV